MTEPSKTYVQLSRAWYGPNEINHKRQWRTTFVDDICIMDNESGAGEIIVSWHQLHAWEPPSPQLHMFSDSWAWFSTHPAFFEALEDNPDMQPEDLCAILDEMGFVDVTPEPDEAETVS